MVKRKKQNCLVCQNRLLWRLAKFWQSPKNWQVFETGGRTYFALLGDRSINYPNKIGSSVARAKKQRIWSSFKCDIESRTSTVKCVIIWDHSINYDEIQNSSPQRLKEKHWPYHDTKPRLEETWVETKANICEQELCRCEALSLSALKSAN